MLVELAITVVVFGLLEARFHYWIWRDQQEEEVSLTHVLSGGLTLLTLVVVVVVVATLTGARRINIEDRRKYKESLREERHQYRTEILALSPREIELEVPNPPVVRNIGQDRRMIAFSEVCARNTNSEKQEVQIRLLVDGDEAVYVPVWESPGMFTRGGPPVLPKRLELEAGAEFRGQLQFRVPFHSSTGLYCKLVVSKPLAERVVGEYDLGGVGKSPDTLSS